MISAPRLPSECKLHNDTQLLISRGGGRASLGTSARRCAKKSSSLRVTNVTFRAARAWHANDSEEAAFRENTIARRNYNRERLRLLSPAMPRLYRFTVREKTLHRAFRDVTRGSGPNLVWNLIRVKLLDENFRKFLQTRVSRDRWILRRVGGFDRPSTWRFRR